MASLNMKAADKAKTTNQSGATAYEMPVEERLATCVLSSFVAEPRYYGGNCLDDLVADATEAAEKDPVFVAKLAVYARREMNMRSTSHVLCSALAHATRGRAPEEVRRAISGCVVRGDDVTEILAAYLSLFGKPLPNPLRRGLRDALGDATPYQIAKYRSESRGVKMADAIKMLRPKPRNDRVAEAFAACVGGTLEMPRSWETEVSSRGNTAEAWDDLFYNGGLGYMALLRNLSNISACGARCIPDAAERIADPIRVANSRQLPFRFLSARDALMSRGADEILVVAVEKALEESVKSCPRLPGRTVVAVDVSGSMGSPLSKDSSVTVADVAALLGAVVANRSDDAVVYKFANGAERVELDRSLPVLAQSDALRGTGGWTDMSSVFKEMALGRIVADRVIFLSDNEVNAWSDGQSGWWRGNGTRTLQSYMDEYRSHAGAKIWMHGWDLQGYGTSQVDGRARNTRLAGWSERGLEFISRSETGIGGMVDEIRAYEI